MAWSVTLKRDGLTPVLFNFLKEYYRTQGVDNQYAVGRWQEWENNLGISVLRAVRNDCVIGWIFYNAKTSTVEDILFEHSEKDTDPRIALIDALVERENLIGASLLKDDTEKGLFFLDYGFRPTHSYQHNGFDMIKMELSISVLMEKTSNKKPFHPWRKKARVAIERIPATHTYDEVKDGLANLIDKLGGIAKFVRPGETVAIKPNIVSDHGLKDGKTIGGIVTDTALVKALVECLLPVASRVLITEGSSINRSETSKMFSHYGYDSIVALDPARINLIDLNNDNLVEKQVPGGKRMTSRKVPVTLDKADVIINVPVLKIHFAAIASLSIKNLQGAMPPLEKYMSHFFGLWQNLVNIHHLIKPKLTIIDGITGLEDFGPVSGTPKKMNLLIGGTNPVATDAVAMRIMGLEPKSSPPVFLAWMQGMGPIEADNIHVVGPSIQEVAENFKQPFIDTSGGTHLTVHADEACPGCKGYLHFVLSKLRRPDPADPDRSIIDRPFEKKVNIFLGPKSKKVLDPRETNILLGLCQQHNAGAGIHLPGCPPHAEVLTKGIFDLFPDLERPKYADETEEAKLGRMLDEIMETL